MKKENPMINHCTIYTEDFFSSSPKEHCQIFKSSQSFIYRILSQVLYFEQRSTLWMKILKYETISKVSWQNCLFKGGKELNKSLIMIYRVVTSQLFIVDVPEKKSFKNSTENGHILELSNLHLQTESRKRKMKCVLGTGISFRNSFIHGYPKHEGLCSLDGWDWRDRIWHTVLDDFRVARLH